MAKFAVTIKTESPLHLGSDINLDAEIALALKNF